MTKKFNNLQLKPTLAEAFEVGKREGSKEAYTELKHMISGNISQDALRTYIDVRLK